MPFDQHVGLADGVRLGVEFLAVHHQPGVGVELGQMLTRHAGHATGANCWVIHAAHYPRQGEHGVVFNEQQVDHEADHLTRGEVLTGSLV